MKKILLFFVLLITLRGESQSNVIIYNYRCNDKWLDELIKTDSISNENRKQDYMCYIGLFDSLEKKTKYTKLELLQSIGKLSKFSDGAFSEGLFYLAFQYVDENIDAFFKIMEKGAEQDLKNWAMMIYSEYGMRSPSEAPFVNLLIAELENTLINKKIGCWLKFKITLTDFEKQHLNQLKK